MQYWIEGIAEPLSLSQVHDRKDRLSPATRCAPVGTNEWRPILEILPDLFEGVLLPEQEPTTETPPQPEVFTRDSAWVVFFYILAALHALGGIFVAVLVNPVAGIIGGLVSYITYLFFAWVSQVLVDIRWLVSRERK